MSSREDLMLVTKKKKNHRKYTLTLHIRLQEAFSGVGGWGGGEGDILGKMYHFT